MEAHSSVLAWRIPMDTGALQAAVHGVAKNRTQLRTKHIHTHRCQVFQSHVSHCVNILGVLGLIGL